MAIARTITNNGLKELTKFNQTIKATSNKSIENITPKKLQKAILKPRLSYLVLNNTVNNLVSNAVTNSEETFKTFNTNTTTAVSANAPINEKIIQFNIDLKDYTNNNDKTNNYPLKTPLKSKKLIFDIKANVNTSILKNKKITFERRTSLMNQYKNKNFTRLNTKKSTTSLKNFANNFVKQGFSSNIVTSRKDYQESYSVKATEINETASEEISIDKFCEENLLKELMLRKKEKISEISDLISQKKYDDIGSKLKGYLKSFYRLNTNEISIEKSNPKDIYISMNDMNEKISHLNIPKLLFDKEKNLNQEELKHIISLNKKIITLRKGYLETIYRLK